jgi:hypothetical protein
MPVTGDAGSQQFLTNQLGNVNNFGAGNGLNYTTNANFVSSDTTGGLLVHRSQVYAPGDKLYPWFQLQTSGGTFLFTNSMTIRWSGIF